MTNAWLLAGLGVVVVLDLALLWLLLGPAVVRRAEGRWRGRDGEGDAAALDIRAIAALDPTSVLGDGVPAEAYDRVVRVASWAYLLSTAAVVYATGLWPEAEDPLLLVLAIGGVFILVAHDLLPATGLGPTRFVVEGAVAITLVSIVVALTGGATSPFFYAYPLVVAGAALVVRPLVTVVLAAIAVTGYLLAVLAAPDGAADPAGQAIIVVNLTALVLLSYVATMVASEQRRTRDAAVRLSTIDALTGLANRGYIIAAVEREIDRATRYRRGFCLLMADLDGLKDLNDTHGHRVGDEALAAVAAVLRENVRRIDTPARLGGDEFVVLLPETDRDGARVVAEKIRAGVAAIRLVDHGEALQLGVSIGLGEWSPGRTLDDIMASADNAMYDVKRRTRRRGNGRRGVAAVGPGPANAQPGAGPANGQPGAALADGPAGADPADGLAGAARADGPAGADPANEQPGADPGPANRAVVPALPGGDGP